VIAAVLPIAPVATGAAASAIAPLASTPAPAAGPVRAGPRLRLLGRRSLAAFGRRRLPAALRRLVRH
jgi:hypothetical protein